MAKNIDQSERELSYEELRASISKTNELTERINARIANDAIKKKCVKCSVELPANADNKRCDDCQIKRNKTIWGWVEAGVYFLGGLFIGYKAGKAIAQAGGSTMTGEAPSDGDWEITICGECEGTGKEECYICEGDGSNPDNDDEECDVCNGDGGVECAVCEGHGKVYHNDDNGEMRPIW